uniref:IQ motif containing GTPase activating protein 3 n=1 Tax=Pelusios castaneus TaxID=367368 RepID=A0A8C8SNC1_9SAUR
MHVNFTVEFSCISTVVQNPSYERLTAEEMDEQRRQNVAYQYLCRLEEAKRWMESCLNEELASPTELEENLRNGVILAKLGHCFAPDVVPLKKIYDPEQMRYKATGLHFRHTDNINHWRDAMTRLGLPSIFHPETTDIYDKKNMPRVVYCIHALSLYLFKLGLAPQIQDLYGKVNFTEEEIDNMKHELEKYGLQMPAFSKIGGILASELSVDEAAVHAAVLAINEAVERGVVEQTLMALRNPNAMLLNLRETLAAVYQEMLYQVKMEKVRNAKNRVRAEPWQCFKTGHSLLVNGALESVDDALERQDPAALCGALQDPVLALRRVQRENAARYLEQLSMDREQKALVRSGRGSALPGDSLWVPSPAHLLQSRSSPRRAVERAVSRINASIRRGVAAETVQELMSPEAQLPEVHPFAAQLYQRELSLLQRQHPQGELVQEELYVAVEMLSAVALINQALEAGDVYGFWSSLISPGLGLSDIEDANAQRYFGDLLKLKHQSGKAGLEFLSWNNIQACVKRANSSVQDENNKILAIRLINEALAQNDPEKTLTALLLPSAGLADVSLPVARRYHDVLTVTLRQKAQVGRSAGALRPRTLHSVQSGIHSLQGFISYPSLALVALGIAAINQAIKEGRPAQTVRVLRNPDVALRGIMAECAGAYQAQLAALMAGKRQAGKKPLKTRVAGEGVSLHLEESVSFGVTAAHDRQHLWESNTPFVVRLQACMRGYLVRQEFMAHRHLLWEQLPAAIKIQFHGWLCFSLFTLLPGAGMVSRISLFPLCLFWQINAVIKIQAFVRANKARGDYRMLVYAKDPPLSIVRRFIHLLERSQHDFWEESELLKLREEVVKRIRSNQQLESDLNLMDIKIGLLVKNRITLQEVVSHCKKLTKKNKDQLSHLMAIDKQKGLKSLSKEKRRKLEAYQHLFYLLQTHPVYLARLIFQMPQNKSTKFMESVVFTLYNYASNPREAYLLLQLFKTALQEEIKSNVDHLRDILTGNPTVIRLVVSFYRKARGQNALRQILGGPVQEVLRDKTLSIRTNPVDIYKAWINQLESQSGQKSKLPYDVSPDQALSHPEVQRRLDISIRNLLALTDRFLSAIISSVDKIPYGMRYVAKILKTSLAEKFPDAGEEEICKIVGNLLYYRFVNPAVVAPDGFDIIDISAGVALHIEHRRTLCSIAKILQHAASNKMFEGEDGHLRVVNQYLEETHSKFRKFICAACSVPEPEERFNVDEYSEMVAVTKPVIYITVAELINTHKLLLEHQDSIAPDHRDPLHELLEDLDELPTAQSLIGESAPNPADGNAEQALAQLGKLEVSLTLTNKFDVEANSEEADTKTMSPLPLSLQEAFHYHLMHRRALREAQTPDRLKRNRSLAGNSQLSMEEKKRKVLRNLRRLESLGVVDSANQYQEIINQMAKDICNQRRYRQQRKGELVKLQQTLHRLNSKTMFYEEQIDYYNQYIQTCLDNLTASSKLNGKSKKQQSLCYTAARLFEKGVLLEIEDLPLSQFRNVIFDIVPCGEAGKFQVKTKFMGIDMEKFPLHYQDLLQLQYEGVAVMKMFNKAKVNVNLLIFLLNKKFFKK